MNDTLKGTDGEKPKVEPGKVETRIVEPKAIGSKPVEPKPVEPKLVEAKPVEPKPLAPKAVAPTPVAPTPVAPKPMAPVAPKPAELKMAEAKSVDAKGAEIKAGETRFESNANVDGKADTNAKARTGAEAAVVREAISAESRPALAPVQAAEEKRDEGRWTRWLVWFLRGMAVLSMAKGLYHWSLVLGIGEGPDTTFTTQSLPWQSATVYFAIIDLVAAVGLWLAAVWGAVVWLTAGVSMAAVEVFFPQIYGGSWTIVAIELFLLCCYLVLALQSAREHPH